MSVLTLGVTLAAEDILGNVAGGLVILSSHPFGIGDTIEAGGTVGTVREISLNHTKLETADGQIVLQPNRALSSSKIINYTTLGRRRVDLQVGVAYGTDLAAARAVALEALKTVPGVLADPAPAVAVATLADSAVLLNVRPWAMCADYWTVRAAVLVALVDAFGGAGVSIPFPQLDVTLRKEA